LSLNAKEAEGLAGTSCLVAAAAAAMSKAAIEFLFDVSAACFFLSSL
jgi:hypothetical protein